MALKSEQYTALAAAIRADTEPEVQAALAVRDDTAIAANYTNNTSTLAWSSIDGYSLFEAIDVKKYDALTQGKRDAMQLMMDFAPVDMGRQKYRKAMQDIWGDTDSISILEACRRYANKGEMVFGGAAATTNTVTALKLNWQGEVSTEDVSIALNTNP